ncbi:Cdc6/Cdc18 family protein [Haloarcula argentinensis]|uniref:Orc1/cdc6 family replication initiation protein n=1 Tax=Haloarcula argentinensis TaxID=43776 RepID=A0ABU2EY82_HALAR|nr:Cdc6/Cdc18 family protein [Haloarcula argentinensis]EMA24626.1 orc1/cdc6 family replication initiation protein [Haloarcula argentinensis DSM 12282]MDS0253259.1 orc1/cdc6 family replication initiation protein [Haloarcula argentinensis]
MMITDARAIRLGEVPQDLHHRDGQINHLSSVLAPDKLTRAEDVCIFGPSGAGKTTVTKYTLQQLEREFLDIDWGYVNCLSDSTTAAAVHKIVRDVGLGADLRRRGSATSEALHRLREHDETVVAVLDEVNTLEERAVLALYEIPNVAVVCITVDEDEWMANLSEQAKSRLRRAATIRLEKYSYTELVDILNSRVEAGLRNSRVDQEALEYIADLAAGDAREAIAMLRRGAIHVRDGYAEKLTIDVVDETVTEAHEELRAEMIRSLGTHHRLLYRIIDEAGQIDAETLRFRYEERAQNPKSSSTRHRYLKDLQYRDLVEKVGESRDAEYRSLESAA